jgi:hypothetical protein
MLIPAQYDRAILVDKNLLALDEELMSNHDQIWSLSCWLHRKTDIQVSNTTFRVTATFKEGSDRRNIHANFEAYIQPISALFAFASI